MHTKQALDFVLLFIHRLKVQVNVTRFYIKKNGPVKLTLKSRVPVLF